MKREIVTMESVNEARRNGRSELVVPYSSVVTASAFDLAASYGITITRCPCGVKNQKNSAAAVCPPDKANGQPALGAGEDIVARIRSEVLQRLPVGQRDEKTIDEIIRRSLETGEVCSCDSCRPVAVGLLPAVPGAAQCGWKGEAGGCIFINSSRLPQGEGRQKKGNVRMTDTITGQDGAAFRTGYMEWTSGSHTWVLQEPEVNVILEGVLHVTAHGQTCIAKPGDTLYFPGGAKISAQAQGPVKVMYVSLGELSEPSATGV